MNAVGRYFDAGIFRSFRYIRNTVITRKFLIYEWHFHHKQEVCAMIGFGNINGAKTSFISLQLAENTTKKTAGTRVLCVTVLSYSDI